MKEEKKISHEGQTSLTIWYDDAVIDRIDRLALKGDVPRSRLIRNLSLIGVEYLESCEKFGILQTAIIMRDFGEWLKGKHESGFSADVERA
jgi:hypothetical protein